MRFTLVIFNTYMQLLSALLLDKALFVLIYSIIARIYGLYFKIKTILLNCRFNFSFDVVNAMGVIDEARL